MLNLFILILYVVFKVIQWNRLLTVDSTLVNYSVVENNKIWVAVPKRLLFK